MCARVWKHGPAQASWLVVVELATRAHCAARQTCSAECGTASEDLDYVQWDEYVQQ